MALKFTVHVRTYVVQSFIPPSPPHKHDGTHTHTHPALTYIYTYLHLSIDTYDHLLPPGELAPPPVLPAESC